VDIGLSVSRYNPQLGLYITSV